MRGTNTYKRFVADVKGSDYSKGFYVDNQADKLFVGESVIDIMSKMTLLKKDGVDYHDYNYLAMAGTQKQEAIENVLDNNRQIKEIFLGMDNDTGGFKAVTKLEETLSDRDILLKRDMPDKSGYDWNDMLCSAAGGKQQEAIANFRRLEKDEKGKEDVQKNLEPTKEADSPEAQNINIFENHGKDKTDIFSMVKDKTKDAGIWKDAPKVRNQ